MNISKLFKKVICLLLCAAMVLPLSACMSNSQAEKTDDESIEAKLIKDDPVPDPSTEVTDPSQYYDQHEAVTQASIELLLKLYQSGKSRLISPMSIYYALAMLANGAEGETLSELEDFMGVDRNTLNYFLYAYYQEFVDGQGIHVANSIWMRNNPNLMIHDSFLNRNLEWLASETHTWDNDQEGVEAINGWVNENTDGMIPSVLDQIPVDAQLYLINAICFEMNWASPFTELDVWDGEFTDYAGKVYETEFMHGDSYQYLDFGNAKGIMKSYENPDYAFVAILPDEDLSTFLSSLSASSFADALANPKHADVSYSLPKFTVQDSMDLSDILKLMGVETVFDPANADLSGIGEIEDGNLFASRVLHKTFIEVAEQGTKAGAVTVVEVLTSGAYMEDTLSLDFNVPFLYMIIDTTTGTPLFIGTFECPEG